MINVTFDQIHSLAPNLETQYRDAFQAHNISQVLRKYEISNTALRVCHFFAQVLTQTGALTSLTENLNYSAEDLMRIWPSRFPSLASAEPYAHDQVKLGNYLYEERMGNTNPGDGFLFRGRGLLQITGRSAYTHFGQQLNFDLAGDPDQAFDPTHCLEVAAAEWAVSGSGGKSCNALADDDNLEGVARAMDGALTDFEERRSWLAKTKSVWLSTPQPASRAIANMGVVDAASAPLASAAAATPAPAPRRAAAFDPEQATLLGQFVEAAYSMFDAHPTNLTPPASPDFPAGFRLAASIQMQDFVLFSTGPVFYGFVAQSTTHLNQFVLAFRGTSSWAEWWDDANAGIRVPFKVPGCGWIGAGFARIYDTIEVVEYPVSALAASASARSLKSAGGLSRQVATLVARHAPAAGPTAFAASAAVSVAGHSLGSALATLYVMENAKTDQLAESARLHFRFAARGRRIVRRGVQRARAHFVAGRQRAGSRAEPAPGLARVHARGYAVPGYLDGEGEVFARVLARVGDPPEPDRSSATTECGLPPGAAGGCCASRGGATENRALRRRADRRGKPHDAQVDKGRTGHDQLDDRRRRRSVISPAESAL